MPKRAERRSDSAGEIAKSDCRQRYLSPPSHHKKRFNRTHGVLLRSCLPSEAPQRPQHAVERVSLQDTYRLCLLGRKKKTCEGNRRVQPTSEFGSGGIHQPVFYNVTDEEVLEIPEVVLSYYSMLIFPVLHGVHFSHGTGNLCPSHITSCRFSLTFSRVPSLCFLFFSSAQYAIISCPPHSLGCLESTISIVTSFPCPGKSRDAPHQIICPKTKPEVDILHFFNTMCLPHPGHIIVLHSFGIVRNSQFVSY